MPAVRAALLLMLALAAPGCGGDRADPRSGATSTTESTPAGVAGGGDCAAHVPTRPLGTVEGLILPRGRVVVGKVNPSDQSVSVEGFVALTPTAFVQRGYRQRRGLRIESAEDEGFEAELVVSEARQRNFWKLRKVCEGGSAFLAVIAAAGR